jgi:tetratricopeptide (TPR) repeat protein
MQAQLRRKPSFYLSQCPSGHDLQFDEAQNEMCSICCIEFNREEDCNCLQCLMCHHEICTKCQMLLQLSKQPKEIKPLSELAGAFLQLASLYSAAGNLDAALILDEQVLSIRRQILPAFHIQLGESMHNLANSYFDLERYEDALTMRMEELEIFERSLPESDSRIAECMEQLALTHSALGQASDALRCDLAVLNMRRRNNVEHHPEIIAALINLSTSYLELGDWANAIPCLEEALLSQQTILSPEDEDICKTMMQLVELYIQGKQLATALVMQKKVLEFFRFHYTAGGVEIIVAARALAKLQEDIGLHKEARKLNAEVIQMCDSRIALLLKDTFWKKYISAISGD